MLIVVAVGMITFLLPPQLIKLFFVNVLLYFAICFYAHSRFVLEQHAPIYTNTICLSLSLVLATAFLAYFAI